MWEFDQEELRMLISDPYRYYKDGCESCSGLGGFLTIGGGNENRK